MRLPSHARDVHLVTVGESDEAVASLKDLEGYLEIHYAKIRSETIAYRPREDVAEVLLDKAQAMDGPLRVIGTDSHWRWREQVFGGVRRAILANAGSPVLMAHSSIMSGRCFGTSDLASATSQRDLASG